MNDVSPAARPYVAATHAFAGGADDPRAFLERCIETIEARDPAIGAFVALDLDGARAAADAAAARWRAGAPLSPIDGMPIAVKDIIETAALPTQQGSPLFTGWRGGRDSASVAALREAGAVVVGKTVTTELAGGTPAATRNPWDLERTPGGSSSGSAAAVASGMVAAALATQVLGSTIRPASFCGCFGFKPSVHAINRGGSFDYFSQSATGVLAATLAETWLVMRAISSRVGGDPGHPGMMGPHDAPARQRPRALALLRTAGWHDTSADARDALERAAEQLVAAGIAVADARGDRDVAAVEEALADAVEQSVEITAWEARWPLNTYDRDGAAPLSDDLSEELAAARCVTQERYAAALERRRVTSATFATLAGRFDACVTLSATGAAPRGLDWTGDPVFATPATLVGAPALSLPLLRADGLPLGLQAIGFEGRDAALHAHAAWLAELLVSP